MKRHAYLMMLLAVVFSGACDDRSTPIAEDNTPGKKDQPIDGMVSMPDAGALADGQDAAHNDVTQTPGDIYLLWQAPGGFAGLGPALEILSDGTVHLWKSTWQLTPHQTSNWDQEIKLAAQEAQELLLIFKDMDFIGLPNDNEKEGECYPMFYLESCNGCPPHKLYSYGSAINLKPQFNVAYEWLDTHLAAITEIELPSTYCTYALGRIPCGEKSCDRLKEICVVRRVWAISYECMSIPLGCEEDQSCSCVGESLCKDAYDLCVDSPAPQTISCECTNC